jgi:hypothetical protein
MVAGPEERRKEIKSMFKISDFYGIIGGMFLLILAYLFLANGEQTRSIVTSLFSGTNNLTKTLQGR